MLRSSLVASAAVMLCAVASAQQRAGIQVSTNLKRAPGIYNLQTGKFESTPSGLNAVAQVIYDNTCSQVAPFVYFLTTTSCEDSVDFGRVPNGGVGPDHKMVTFQVG